MKMRTKSTYRYSHTVGFVRTRGPGFFHPVDAALGRDGVIYVLNRAVHDNPERLFEFLRVTMCTVNEEYLGEFSKGGTGEGDIMWPSSIATDKYGNVYISDEALQRISIFDRTGQYLSKWGSKGRGDGEFDRPAGIAFDHEDNLLVVDGLNNRVQRYSKDGRFLGGWGKAGNGEGEFDMPWGVTVDQAGDVYVADWRNDRIQKFDEDGKFLASWGHSGQGDGEFKGPSGVAVDREGNIYIADWGNERVQVLGPDGDFIAKFRGESGLSKWTTEYFDANPHEFEERQKADLELEPDLSPCDSPLDEAAKFEKVFWGPTSVKVDEQGRVYVVDTLRHRIQVYVKGS